MFLRDISEENLLEKNADQEQIQLTNKSKKMGKGKIAGWKWYFLNNIGLLSSATEFFFIIVKAKIFRLKKL